MFLCTVYKPKVALALKFFTDIQDKQDEMEIRLTEIEDNLKKLQLVDSIEVNPSDQTQPTLQTEPVSQSKEQISEMVSSYINEEKSKRHLNVIVHNVIESTSEDPELRRKHDIDSVSSNLSSSTVESPTLSTFKQCINYS